MNVTLEGSFSAVSKPISGSKYIQCIQTYKICALLHRSKLKASNSKHCEKCIFAENDSNEMKLRNWNLAQGLRVGQYTRRGPRRHGEGAHALRARVAPAPSDPRPASYLL